MAQQAPENQEFSAAPETRPVKKPILTASFSRHPKNCRGDYTIALQARGRLQIAIASLHELQLPNPYREIVNNYYPEGYNLHGAKSL